MRPVYVHMAARTKSYRYNDDAPEMRQSLAHFLSIPANDVLRAIPAPIDGIFLSNQRPYAQELVVNHLTDGLLLFDHNGNRYRLNGINCFRVETATNGLTAVRAAVDHLQSGCARTVLVVGGEKLSGFQRFVSKGDYETGFRQWAEDMVSYVASSLANNDRRYCQSMPAAVALIINYYARSRSIKYDVLKELIGHLAILGHENVRANPNGLQRLGSQPERSVADLYKDGTANRMRVYPLQHLDMSPVNTGAGAILLSTDRELPLLNGNRSRADVALTGCAIAQDTVSLAERRSFDSFPATRLAAKRAYTQAGLDLRNWQDNIAPLLVEQHDAFVPLTLINLEDLLLFTNHLDVLAFLRSDLKSDSCPLWLNPSGGLLEGHPFAGTAIIKLVECFARLTKNPMFREWSSRKRAATTAVVHSFGGIGSSVGVAVLDQCDRRTGTITRTRVDVGHYLNLGSRVERAKTGAESLLSGNGEMVSLAKLSMPSVTFDESFRQHFGSLRPDGIAEILLALIQTPQGLVYALAKGESSETRLTPEDLCASDIFVAFEPLVLAASDTFRVFRITERRRRSLLRFREVE